MRRISALLLPILTAFATPLAAQEIAYEDVSGAQVVYLDPAGIDGANWHFAEAQPAPAPQDAAFAAPLAVQRIAYEPVWEVVTYVDTYFDKADNDGAGERFVGAKPAPEPRGVAAYGPFRVLDSRRAALVDVTDERSPAAFAAMLHDYPGIALLEMVECPGTEDDHANLKLGRMIHALGMATHVPDGGSVRSGAVELFLAGARRSADPGAEFAVHAWADDQGLEPQDYAPDAPENRAYLNYYREMGMDPAEAASFYDMTNSVPNADARWMTAAEMRRWVRLD